MPESITALSQNDQNKPEEKWSQKTLLQYWKEEVKSGVRYRTIYGKSNDWPMYKNMYRGFWDNAVVPVNIIYAIGRSIIPQVYFRNPRVSVSAMRPGFTPQAMVLERLDNYLLKATGVKNELKSNVLDSYLCGRGPGILGYDSEFGFNPSFVIEDGEDSGLTGFNKSGNKIEYTDNVKPGMPWYLRCNPEDFIVPWGTRRWEEARWFAIRKMRPKRDVLEDPKYKATKDLKAVYTTKMEGSPDGSAANKVQYGEHDTGGWVELFEIHDKRTKRVYVISLDHDDFLRNDEDFLQYADLPARVLGFNEDPDYFWWTPDTRLIQVQQLEINDIRTMAKKHRRVGLLKMLVDKSIKQEELDKLLDENPKSVARIDVGPQGDIRKVAAFLQSHVPPDLISYAAEVREDVREIIGFSRNQTGSFEAPSGRRTATEANIVRAAAMIRIDERRDILADHLESVVKGYNNIIFDNWTEKRVIDIIGPNAQRLWVKFSGREIKGDFHYTINPEEQTPQDASTRRADSEAFMALASKVPGIDMGYVLQQWSRQFDWIDPSQLLPGNGPGRSAENALDFTDLARFLGRGSSAYPALGG